MFMWIRINTQAKQNITGDLLVSASLTQANIICDNCRNGLYNLQLMPFFLKNCIKTA